ncbi:hypothetical protein RJT34_24654 [Clitoria ternatea]|uniref:Gag1-like clamp domain-containing protein n=1 Tax=Clitoria ternatea TaxID=43366 RepID=A0AAN9FR47_CLITE
MEVCAESSHSNGKQTLEHSRSADEVKRPSDKPQRSSHPNGKQNLKQTSTFINHAAIAWHEDRRKWVGDKSQHQPRTAKDPIISWTTSYEDLLSTNEPFAEPIPLPEMVDFLVDVWYDDEVNLRMLNSSDTPNGHLLNSSDSPNGKSIPIFFEQTRKTFSH